MSRHDRTPYFEELGRGGGVKARGYGVSSEVLEMWGAVMLYNQSCRARSLHAACDCVSHKQHQARNFCAETQCTRPLATVLVEQHIADQMTMAYLRRRCPWVPDSLLWELVTKWPVGPLTIGEALDCWIGQPNRQHH
jgi:hypothetical protein